MHSKKVRSVRVEASGWHLVVLKCRLRRLIFIGKVPLGMWRVRLVVWLRQRRGPFLWMVVFQWSSGRHVLGINGVVSVRTGKLTTGSWCEVGILGAVVFFVGEGYPAARTLFVLVMH